MFAMDGVSGRLMLAGTLDATQQHKYVLTVMASDKSQPPNTDTAKVRKAVSTSLVKFRKSV